VALTQTNHLMGSPVYMAPEQLASSRTVDGRADIWGLGVVLYELLTAEAPFTADSVLELAIKVRSEEHRRVTELRPEIPPGLAAVVDRCLEKSREQRFPNIAALAQALELYASPESGSLVRRIERIGRGPSDHATLDEPISSRPELGARTTTASQATMAAVTKSTVLDPQTPRPAGRRRRLAAFAVAAFALAFAGFAAQRNLRGEAKPASAQRLAARALLTSAPASAGLLQPSPQLVTTSPSSTATASAASAPATVAAPAPHASPLLKPRKPATVIAKTSTLPSDDASQSPALPSVAAISVAPAAPAVSAPPARKHAIDRSRPW
jgi:eukaryotic-like serine/threonine-protein kinase